MKPTKNQIIKKIETIYDRDGTSMSEDRANFADWILSRWPEESASGQYIKVPEESEWPEWAIMIAIQYYGKLGTNQAIQHIPRPAPKWRPKEGDKAWWFNQESKSPILFIFGNDSTPTRFNEMLAAAESLDEITWTREQFRARGKVWEAHK